MIRNKTVAELEALGFQVFVNYRTNGYGDIDVTSTSTPASKPKAEEAKSTPPAAKSKSSAKPKTKDELHVVIRSEMVRVSKVTSKKDAMAIMTGLGHKKLGDVPEEELLVLLKALQEVV